MKIKDLRPFIPCKDYNTSRDFYSALSFEIKDAGPDLTIVSKGSCTFFLQRFYHEGLAKNLMLQLIVEDVEEVIQSLEKIQHIKIRHSPITEEVWGRVVYLWGPSDELWHITQLGVSCIKA